MKSNTNWEKVIQKSGLKVTASPEWGETASKQYKVEFCRNRDKNLFGEENWQNVSLSRVTRDKNGVSDYLPRYLFAYYSGPSDRLESDFKKHRTDFYRRLLNYELKLEGEIRPLFYAKPIHSQFVLLAFFLGSMNEQELAFLRDQLGIEDLDSVHFVFKAARLDKIFKSQ